MPKKDLYHDTDKIKNYQTIVMRVLETYHAFLAKSTPLGATETRDELLFDTERNHFQLLTMSWQQHRFVYTIAFHIDIIEEKIWIQQNNTELDIAAELLENGISKENIVLGFIAPQRRLSTGFAA